MPRLPTILVMGSQDISLTITLCCSGVSVAMCVSPQDFVFQGDGRLPTLDVAGGQRGPAPAPLGLDVVVLLDVALAHEADDGPIGELHDVGGDTAEFVLVHERHVLVGEPRHRACHADPADVRAAADAVHPAADGDVALDDRPLAAELHQAAVVRSVLGGELALLAEARAVAALSDGASEQPLWA